MMRAAVWHGPGDLRAEDRDRPSAADGEVVVQVSSCGVCGTDARIVAGKHRHYSAGTVRVPGHEIVGRVVEVGRDVGIDVPKAVVFVAPNYGCGACRECLSGNNNRCADFRALGITEDGGFAEFVRVPAAAVRQGNLIALSHGIDPAVGALIEPLACVVRGQAPLGIGPADTVLIIGGGPIGILHAALARLKGAGPILISDRSPLKLDLAKRLGADVSIRIDREDVDEVVQRVTGGRGADVVIVAAPSPEETRKSLQRAAVGGRISFFAGLPKDAADIAMDANAIHYRELLVSGTTACSTLDCLHAADIVNVGRIDLAPLVSQRIPIDALPPVFGTRDPARVKSVVVF